MEEMKVRYYTRNQVQNHQGKPGNKNISKSGKTTKPYKVRGIKGATIICWRGGKEKERGKENK